MGGVVAGKALLIGAGIDGLEGTAADIAAMKEALSPLGLTMEICDGPAATREGILAAYRRLIDSVGPDDVAVVYYTGHGGRVTPPPPDAGPGLMDLQFIAPFDFHETTPDDFHGITSVELSVLLAELSDKTANATVVLDCCHAAMMSRDGGLRLKAQSEPTPYEQVRNHIDRLSKAGLLDVTRFRTAGSERAVRIVACQPFQSAYEYTGRDGKQIGLLTEALTTALAAAGSESVSWATIMDSVRRQVIATTPGQRPDVEGPARRLTFSVEQDDMLSTLPVSVDPGGRVWIECAPLLGVRVGDEFMIMPPGAVSADPDKKVGDLTVTAVGPLTATGAVAFAATYTGVPLGARAFRTKVAAPTIAVAVPTDGPGAADIASAVKDAPLLRLADIGEPGDAEVRIGADGTLTLCDRIGPLHAPRPGDRAGLAQLLRDLKAIAQAAALRGLGTNPQWALPSGVSVEWGRVVNGVPTPLPAQGETIRVGDSIYVTVRNASPQEAYVSLIDIGVSGRIAVLTDLTRGGQRIDAGREWTFGYEEFSRTLPGVQVIWPDGLDASAARPESIIALVTSDPQDVSALEQDGIARGDDGWLGGSPLEQLVRQLSTGRTREVARITGPTVRYDVHLIDFELGPIPDAGRFLIDERPDPAALHVVSKGASASKVAVRVEELIVHRNRALFGADIRVDALVVTGRHDDATPVYRARTERFRKVRDGQVLPLDHMLVYHGPAVDYLDLAVWVSRDSDNSHALGDLLAGDLTGDEVRQALTTLGGMITTAPHAAAAAVLIGASAVVINVAYRSLRRITGDSIGVYRGSRLASEQFGAGRHPAIGARRAQDFSIAYRVELIS
jgi:hypothetical protein